MVVVKYNSKDKSLQLHRKSKINVKKENKKNKLILNDLPTMTES